MNIDKENKIIYLGHSPRRKKNFFHAGSSIINRTDYSPNLEENKRKKINILGRSKKLKNSLTKTIESPNLVESRYIYNDYSENNIEKRPENMIEYSMKKFEEKRNSTSIILPSNENIFHKKILNMQNHDLSYKHSPESSNKKHMIFSNKHQKNKLSDENVEVLVEANEILKNHVQLLKEELKNEYVSNTKESLEEENFRLKNILLEKNKYIASFSNKDNMENEVYQFNK